MSPIAALIGFVAFIFFIVSILSYTFGRYPSGLVTYFLFAVILAIVIEIHEKVAALAEKTI